MDESLPLSIPQKFKIFETFGFHYGRNIACLSDDSIRFLTLHELGRLTMDILYPAPLFVFSIFRHVYRLDFKIITSQEFPLVNLVICVSMCMVVSLYMYIQNIYTYRYYIQLIGRNKGTFSIATNLIRYI